MKKKTNCNGLQKAAPDAVSGLGGDGFLRGATSPSISETQSDGSLDGNFGTLCILNTERLAVRVTKIKLGQITLKVLFATMLVDPFHSSLED